MKFQLVDRITGLESGESARGVKNLSAAEEYLGDHFPGFPVMPGVLMLEALTQLSAWIVREATDFEPTVVLLKEAKAVKYNSFLVPGKTLELESMLGKRDGREWTFKTAGRIRDDEGGEPANGCSAKLTLTAFTLGEQNPAQAEADERLRAAFREQFATLWQPAGSAGLAAPAS